MTTEFGNPDTHKTGRTYLHARNILWSVLLFTGLAASTPVLAAGEQEYAGADRPGPVLTTNTDNPSVAAYNNAISLYLESKYPEALEEMRAAMRANQFGYSTLGLAFSNLCLMYLKVGKYKNAQAACNKALVILPAYVPATINLARAESRIEPPEKK